MEKTKKIASRIAAVALVAVIMISGTLALLTDTDAQVNTFTTGNVDIDLWEDFGDNSGIEKLLPSTGSAQNDTLKNGIEKEVYVTNTGSEDAYVRVHIAIPTVLDDGADTFDASANLLHFNFDENSVGKGVWDWSKTTGEAYTGDWNYYKVTIDNIEYNVYVVTYESQLAPEETTVNAINQVYLDKEVTNDDIAELKEKLGDSWYIYVAAEACQKAGYNNAYEALNDAFGTPGNYSVDWKTVTGKTFIESDTVEGLVTEVKNVSTTNDLKAALEIKTIGNETVKVVLENDITIADRATVTGNIILDMQGHTIVKDTSAEKGILRIEEGASLTITGDGKMSMANHNSNMIYTVGELIIMNGIFAYEPYTWGECSTCSHGNNIWNVGNLVSGADTSAETASNITIYGGTFDCGVLNPVDFVYQNKNGIMYHMINNDGTNGTEIVIHGGTFVSASPADGEPNAPYSLYLEGQTEAGKVPENYSIIEGTTEDGRTTYTVNYSESTK